jgi:hypothetical protein
MCIIFQPLAVLNYDQCYDQFNQRLPSIKLATNSGTFANGLEATTFCTRSGFEANPNPIGKETDSTGRASRVCDIIAVARLWGTI